MNAKQKQPGYKKVQGQSEAMHNGYKRPKTLISNKAKKLNIYIRWPSDKANHSCENAL